MAKDRIEIFHGGTIVDRVNGLLANNDVELVAIHPLQYDINYAGGVMQRNYSVLVHYRKYDSQAPKKDGASRKSDDMRSVADDRADAGFT